MWQTTRQQTKEIVMTPISIDLSSVAVWIVLALVGIITFFIIRLINSIDKISVDLNDIKVFMKELVVKHEAMEEKIDRLERETETIKRKLNLV